MFNKLKQIKDLRQQAKTIQGALSEESAEGKGLWGKVRITMNGNQEVTDVNIDPELLSPDQKSKLESGVKDAVNEVVKKVQRVMADKVKKMGGLNMPGM